MALAGAATQEATAPYGPVVAALRAYLRAVPDGLRECGPLTPYLALLLPELGPAPAGGDRPTLFEAIHCALATIASRQPTAIFLDDLQWADATTLELLLPLAGGLAAVRCSSSGPTAATASARPSPAAAAHRPAAGRAAARADDRAARSRRDDGAGRAGPRPRAGRALAATLYHRTQGLPFFVEELAAALAESGRLGDGPAGLELARGEEVPVPDTVRDAVLLRAEGLSKAGRTALAAAAAAGPRFDLELVAALADEAGLAEAIERGLIAEVAPGQGAFRHALAREAFYGEVGWLRQRALHRQLATLMEARSAAPYLVAEHWLAARELERARPALVAAAEAASAVHAYRDAAEAARRALEVWPEGEDEAGRLAVLDRLGQCAQLAGDQVEATRAWREVADGRRAAGDARGLAEAERRLAGAYELQGNRERAFAARQAAAEAFAASAMPGEAAAERLAAAVHFWTNESFEAALDAIRVAAAEAARAERPDLQARALGLEGVVRARLGDSEAGLSAARAGLTLALDRDLVGAAVEVYLRLANVLQYAADYAGARDAFLGAVAACEGRGETEAAHVCLVCLVDVLTQTGEWERAVEICHEVLASAEASPDTRDELVRVLGVIHACRGEAKRARALLNRAAAATRRHVAATDEIEVAGALARVEELDGALDAAAERYRFVLGRWGQPELRRELQTGLWRTGHVIRVLRSTATFFADRGAGQDVRACANALAEIAGETGSPDALAALAHALGEVALVDGDAERAARQFERALELLRELEVPFERAQTELRAGVALAAAGQREAGVKHLANAYRAARRLGARPLAERAARELVALGEQVERRLGRRAAGQLGRGGLSRRELEVLRLLAVGRTNREIAQELFLSARTVDMHVRNVFTKLDCRTRGEAAHKAGILGLLA